MSSTFTLLAFLFLSPFANAFEGSISFTSEEQVRHEAGIDTLMKEAVACSRADFERHTAFFKRYGFSPFYGEGSDFGQKSESKKRRYLRKKGFDPDLLDEMEAMSCVGYVMKCLGKGFAAAGQNDLWQRIRTFTKQNGSGGLALQHGLQKLGWKVLFWLPDERRNNARAEYERREDPKNRSRFWGFHDERLRTVRAHSTYLENSVDDATLLVNFGQQVPTFLKQIPFYVGSAHGGYHVFSGSHGNVMEEHSLVDITDPKSVDISPFNPMASQGPSEGMLFSGLVAIPARYLR